MPPKKKGGKKKKGKKKDGQIRVHLCSLTCMNRSYVAMVCTGEGDSVLSVDEMYKRSAQEVLSLKQRLAERQEYARRSRASEELMRDQMQEAKIMVEEERVTKREITYGKPVKARHKLEVVCYTSVYTRHAKSIYVLHC